MPPGPMVELWDGGGGLPYATDDPKVSGPSVYEQQIAGRRKAIEDQGYRIVASVGDQYSDLAGGHEAAAFKLPNPFYFLP